MALVLELDPALQNVDELEARAMQMRLARELGTGRRADDVRSDAPLGGALDAEVPVLVVGAQPAIEERLAIIAGTSACHLAVSSKRIDIDGVWGPYFEALLPERWLTEAGISASGAFLDLVLKSHPAARDLPADRFGASARYGAFAMEQLINKVLTRGTGKKTNLEIKVFGGGLINTALTDVGAKNIAFVREFLSNEGYTIAGEDVGGMFARRVMFKPYSGKAFVKRLDAAAGADVARDELKIVTKRVAPKPAAPAADDIELF